MSGEGETTLTYSASDLAGNTTSGAATIRIDLTDPEIEGRGALGSGATVALGAEVAAQYTCTDALSGIDTCSGSVGQGELLDTSTAGTFPVTIESTDLAGKSPARPSPTPCRLHRPTRPASH